jgi:hypothetical protein
LRALGYGYKNGLEEQRRQNQLILNKGFTLIYS